MKNRLQQFSVKLLAATLAIILAIPTNVFAMKQSKSNIYTAATSVMGVQEKDTSKEETENTDFNLIKSAVSQQETTDYIIEKSARLSKTTGDVDYKIVVKAKNPSTEPTGEQTTTFAITENTDDEKLSVDDVKALDANGNETDINFNQHTPNLLNTTKENIRTTGITSAKPQYGMVYYISTKLTEEALKNLEEKSPQLALDFTIASPNQNPVQTRYSLATTNPDTTQITINNDGNVVNQTENLVEKEDNLHLYKGEYKKEEKTIFQTTPAQLVWTDYINAKDDKEFAINFDLDENQDTENSQIKIDYYEARDKGYVLNQSFSKTVDFTNSLNLTIPQGYIAKVSLSTAIKENTNAKVYTFNGVKVANPTYKEEKTEKTEEEQASDDADPLPDDFLKNAEKAKSSNNSIADESEQDFSESPKSDTSAIALNKEAYLENLRDEEKLTENLEKAANDIELALQSYNKEETDWDEFKIKIQNIGKEQNLDQAHTEEILQALLAGLNEDKYKVANIDTKEATTAVEESTNRSELTDATEKSVDQLVKEKLNEEGITIEDFQNYMYELEEKYNLTNEDADRIYKENAEAIQALVTKAQEEKTTGDVFAADNQSAFRKTYPYDIDYWTYQYYDASKNTINWDIRVETDQVNLDHLDYQNLGLSLYAPENQKLSDYKVTVRDYLGNDISTNANASKVREGVSTSGRDISKGTLKASTQNLLTYNLDLPKSSLPDDLIIHVEATPTDAARFTFYDLGLRLTPDKNYINTIVQQFKDDWAKLVAAMPWIIPYKSGDAAAAKFADGFNVVDTRLPAYTYGIGDDSYSTRVYSDKSRSVYGQFINNTQIKWEVSETLRLQDDDRLVSSGSLGDDILDATFTNSDGSGVRAYVEVLEPKEDGSFTKIYETTTNSAATLRNGLSQKKDVLKPGTVINYIFTKSVNDPTVESTITIDFHERFDDEVETYGGKKEAYVRKLSTQEQNDRYHIGKQLAIRKNLNGSWRYENMDPFRVSENYDMVFCINPSATQPVRDVFWNNNNYKIEKKDIDNSDDLYPYLQKRSTDVLTASPKTKEQILDDIKKVFYYGEIKRNTEEYFKTTEYNSTFETHYFPDEKYFNMMQYALGAVSADPNRAQQFLDSLGGQADKGKELYNYIMNLPEGEWTDEKRQSVELTMYANNHSTNTDTGSVGNSPSQYQNMITGKVYLPVNFLKVNSDSEPLPGAEFELRSETGSLIKKWTSTSDSEELFLKPGEYKIYETKTPNNQLQKIDPITINVTEGWEIRNNSDIPLQKNDSKSGGMPASLASNTIASKETLKYYGGTQDVVRDIQKSSFKFSNIEPANYYQPYRTIEVIGSQNDINQQLVSYNSNDFTITAKNILGSKVEINKKLLAEDGNYYDAPGISFTLENGSKTLTETTDRYGIATFDNLPLGSQWTLKELPDETGAIENIDTTWNVSVDSNGKVNITENKADTDPSDVSTIGDNGSITIRNRTKTSNTGGFEVLKVDDSGKKLDGAEFTVYEDSNLENILNIDGEEQSKTTVDGKITFENLPDGTYYLKESKAPESYILDGIVWTVSVKDGVVSISSDKKDNSKFEIVNSQDTDTLSQIKVINRQATYPSTGGSGTFIGFALIGTAVMLAAIAYYGIYANNKNGRRA